MENASVALKRSRLNLMGTETWGVFLRRGLEVFGNGSDISPPLFLDLHEMGLIFDTMCAKVPIIIVSVCQGSRLS